MNRCHFPTASEHACFVFYPVTLTPDQAYAQTTLQQMLASGSSSSTCRSWIPLDALPSITDKRAEWSVWETANLTTGDDLYPHIHRLLGNHSKADPTDNTVHASVYRVSEPTRKLLQGKRLAYPADLPKAARQPHALTLQLTTAGIRRIREHLPDVDTPTLTVQIHDAHLIVFRTDTAFLLLELGFGNANTALHPSLIVEGLYRLSHFHRLAWQTQTTTTAECFSLAELAYSLIGQTPQPVANERIYTSSVLQLRESPEPAALTQLLTQLSRRYTDDYLLADTPSDIEIVNHFKSVHHAFALEGSATVIDLGLYKRADVPEYLQHFTRHTYRINYLPIILLGYHEFVFLLNVSNQASLWPQAENENTQQHLIQLRSQISSYMLCYRFSYVSHVSMHNAVNQALRKALGLDKMLLEVERDTAQIDSILSLISSRNAEASRKRNEQRFRWITIISTGALAWMASNKFFSDVFKQPILQQFTTSWGFTQGTWEDNIAFILAIVMALIAVRIALWKTSGGQGKR